MIPSTYQNELKRSFDIVEKKNSSQSQLDIELHNPTLVFGERMQNMVDKYKDTNNVVNKEALNHLIQAHDAKIEGRDEFMKYDPL